MTWLAEPIPTLLAAARDLTTLGLHLPSLSDVPKLDLCDKHRADLSSGALRPVRYLILVGAFVTLVSGAAGLLVGLAVGSGVSLIRPRRPETQVLVHYPEDENGLVWHHRVLLYRVAGGRSVCLTPDLGMQIHDFNVQRHRIIGRREAFPPDLAARCYVFDDDGVGRAQLDELKRQARVQAAILGDVEFEDAEEVKWLVYEAGNDHFGKEVPVEVLEDDQRFVSLGTLGVVDWLGEKRLAEGVAADNVDEWRQKREETESDSRILGIHRKHGKRNLALHDAVQLFTEDSFEDWPFPPPRASLEYLESIRDGPGSMVVYESEWRQDSGVGDGTAALHEHRNNAEVLRLAHQVDQLNIPNLACFEQLVRRQVQIEMAVERNAKHPDYGGLDLVLGGPTTESGAASSQTFRDWVYKKQGERAQTLKQVLPSDGDSVHSGATGSSFLSQRHPLLCPLLPALLDTFGSDGLNSGIGIGETLSELTASRDLYSQEPKNLAEYDIDKLKICRSGTVAKDAKSLLPPDAAGLIRHYARCIERDSEQILELQAARDFPRPYWDPTLARDQDGLLFLVDRLRQANLISFRRKLKAKIGIFFVKKKDPAWIMLIIDARQANRCHRAPPKTKLVSVGGFCELDLSDSALRDLGGFGPVAEVWGGTSDVDDCFYQMLVEELGSWFGIDMPRTAGEWGVSSVYDDDVGRHVPIDSTATLYPVFHGMAMGWSWALHLANEAVSFLASKSAVCPRSLVRERTPAPALRVGQAVSGVYVDNFTTIAGDRLGAEDSIERFRRAAAEAGIGTHVDGDVGVVFESLGVVFDGRQRCLRHLPRRVWRVYLATRALRRRRWVHGNILDLDGPRVNLFGLLRPGLSCFQQVYPFVANARGRRVRLTDAVKNEMRLVQGLLFLCEYDLGADFSREVYCSDSSDIGFALLSTRATEAELRELTRYRERWRFKLVETLSEVALVRPEWAEYVGGRLRPGGGADLPEGAYAEVEVPSAIPPVDQCWDTPRRWAHLRVGRWKWTKERINIKEGRASLFGSRRATRTRHNHGKRVASLGDNLVSICAFEKGRAKSWALNSLARRAAGYQIAARVRWHSRHIESKRNAADAGSRLHQSGAKFDLTRKSIQNLIKSWILAGLVWHIHLGTPCTAWSIARRGVVDLGKAHAQEAIAVELALFTAEVCTLASRCGVLWSLENAAASGLWEFGPVVDLMWLPEVFKVTFHMCQHEVSHKKPTTILTNMLALRGLEESTAGEKSKDIYRRELARFFSWAEERGLSTKPDELAITMKQYFYVKFQEGYGPGLGRSVFFGYLLLHFANYMLERDRLSDVERALAGWAKRARETVKDPAPQEVLLDMAVWMLDRGRGESASCMALQLGDYARPSESVDLVLGNVLKPVVGVRGAPSRDWGIVFAPAELGFVTMTGQRDFRDAAKALGYEKLNITPHTVRHTAPSHDIYHKHRTLEQVRRRGRWAAKKSVTRYERHAKLLKQHSKLTTVQIARMNRRGAPGMAVCCSTLGSVESRLEWSLGGGTGGPEEAEVDEDMGTFFRRLKAGELVYLCDVSISGATLGGIGTGTSLHSSGWAEGAPAPRPPGRGLDRRLEEAPQSSAANMGAGGNLGRSRPGPRPTVESTTSGCWSPPLAPTPNLDQYCSHGWMFLAEGRKRWTVFHPEDRGTPTCWPPSSTGRRTCPASATSCTSRRTRACRSRCSGRGGWTS
ncbi:unnamed protein product [Prorocentrum cordatum]|uniref:RNA-directed RNA polymerase n=1 Tax=Prorocentrum cordatum TaxID=2364126 RepID=A0ABN9T1R5_9DINO|nr:unnamed protein product [Polarella glacialis]